MLRYSTRCLKVSAFSLFLKDLAKKGALKKVKNPVNYASKQYHRLSPASMHKLQKRAAAMTYPALDAYNQFQKLYAKRFRRLTNVERQRKVALLWATLKRRGTLGKQSTKSKRSRSATTARKKVKRASKALATA